MKKTWKIVGRHIVLAVLAIIWLIPVFWLVVTTFGVEKGINTNHFFPEHWTLANYHQLFFEPDAAANFPAWFKNSMIIGVFSCLVSSIFVIMTAYAFSFIEFKGRKKLMSFSLILGMFPGFMSMAATYNIMEIFGLKQQLFALVIVYSAGAGLGYQVAKGFFDTIPRSLDEAAKIDGATRNQIFWIIILPLSKPIIVYTALTTFIGPWADYIFVSYFMKDNESAYTVALGLFKMLSNETYSEYFTVFCAGAVLIAIPITILFVIMQRFYVAGVTGGAVKG